MKRGGRTNVINKQLKYNECFVPFKQFHTIKLQYKKNKNFFYFLFVFFFFFFLLKTLSFTNFVHKNTKQKQFFFWGHKNSSSQ